jgi:hypothetical protein
MSPQKARIRMYKVGFGDCFLLSFFYAADKKRHILIDFGTTKAPEGNPNLMKEIAEDIRTETGGELDVVVATHRHKDHISGFATTSKGDGPGNIIRSLKPKVVLLPWTEDPDAKEDAKVPTKTKGAIAVRKQLTHMHAVAEGALGFSQTARAGVPEALRGRLAFLGEDNIKNVEAVKNLLTMAKECRYLYFGANPGLADALPGVSVKVLGPPTLEQSDKIRKERATDKAQFWMIAAASAAVGAETASKPIFARRFIAPDGDREEEVRWLTERLSKAQAEQMLGIVTVLDNAMNNTSLILLFEVNGKKLLFPGDAQIENWEYALSKADVVAKLGDVDLYKVGHHGSRNATPVTLWNRFSKRSESVRRRDRLKTLLSTEAGKHGTESEHTEVPRKTLVAELTHKSEFHTTQALRPGASVAFEDIEVQF